jgi:hypothetical protein
MSAVAVITGLNMAILLKILHRPCSRWREESPYKLKFGNVVPEDYERVIFSSAN